MLSMCNCKAKDSSCHWRIQSLPLQRDPILLFSHTFSPKSTQVGCRSPLPPNGVGGKYHFISVADPGSPIGGCQPRRGPTSNAGAFLVKMYVTRKPKGLWYSCQWGSKTSELNLPKSLWNLNHLHVYFSFCVIIVLSG